MTEKLITFELEHDVRYSIEVQRPYIDQDTVNVINNMIKTKFGENVGKINSNTRMFKFSIFGLETRSTYNSKYYQDSIKIIDAVESRTIDNEYCYLTLKDQRNSQIVNDTADAFTYGVKGMLYTVKDPDILANPSILKELTTQQKDNNKEINMENIIKDFESKTIAELKQSYAAAINEIEQGNKFNKFVASCKSKFAETFKKEIEQSVVVPKLVVEVVHFDLTPTEQKAIEELRAELTNTIKEINDMCKTAIALINSADTYEQKRDILDEFGILDN